MAGLHSGLHEKKKKHVQGAVMFNNKKNGKNVCVVMSSKGKVRLTEDKSFILAMPGSVTTSKESRLNIADFS